MTVADHKNGKLITLSKAFDSKSKILYAFYFFVFFLGGAGSLLKLFDEKPFSGLTIFVVVFSSALFIAAYKFVNKATMSEKIFINKQEVQLIKKGLFNLHRKSFDIAFISNFRHLDKPAPTRHPLAGETFDYLGFQTEQQVINEMYGDNRVAFDYEGKTISFGENVYSWEFSELEVLLYDITGNDLRYTDGFEKTFHSK